MDQLLTQISRKNKRTVTSSDRELTFRGSTLLTTKPAEIRLMDHVTENSTTMISAITTLPCSLCRIS